MSGLQTLLAEFHLLRPMSLLLVIPVGIVWWYCVRTEGALHVLSRQVSPHLLGHLVVTPGKKSRVQPAMVLLGVWLLGTIALAGPSWRQEPSPFASDSSNLWVVLKLTASMESDDVLPSRLERVRNKLHDLMELREGAATGLIVYSQSAHLVMPPTSDGGVIDEMLQSLDPQVMPHSVSHEGDSLVEALAMASAHIERDAVAASVLVVADASESSQLASLQQWRDSHRVSVQWLVPIAMTSSRSGLGVDEASRIMSARLQQLTADDTDIRQITRRAKSSLVASTTDPSVRWRDEGYWLLWPIVMGAALWSRRGWSVALRSFS